MVKWNDSTDLREVELTNIVVGKAALRTCDVDSELNELVSSIQEVGILVPITVSRSKNEGYFDLIFGQRRLLACKRLGKPTILAHVLARELDESQITALAVAESTTSRPLRELDVIDACTALYRKLGSIRAVAEETGLTFDHVRKYVKYDRLIPELKKLVDEGMRLNVALKAQDATMKRCGEVDSEAAVLVAREMSTMSAAQAGRIARAKKRNPEREGMDLVKEARAGDTVVVTTVHMGSGLKEALQGAATGTQELTNKSPNGDNTLSTNEVEDG